MVYNLILVSELTQAPTETKIEHVKQMTEIVNRLPENSSVKIDLELEIARLRNAIEKAK